MTERRHRRHRRGTIAWWFAVAVVLASCSTGAATPSANVSSTPTAATPGTAPTTAPTSTPSAAPSLVIPEHIDATGALRLDVRPFADWVVVAGGSAWVAVGQAVTRLDGNDGSELSSTPVPGETCLAMDVGFESVWAGACAAAGASMVRIDTASGDATATIPLGVDLQFEGSVAAGEGAVWAVSIQPNQSLLKIDPATDALIATYPLEGVSAGVRAAYGAVWITRPDDDAVIRVEPADGTITTTIPVGDRPRFIAVGDGAVWAMNEADGSVSRIDPATNRVVATIAVSPRSVSGGDIAAGGGAVWARVSDVLVARIDATTNQVTARYGPAAGSGSVAADESAAWISAHDVNTVWRLPLES